MERLGRNTNISVHREIKRRFTKSPPPQLIYVLIISLSVGMSINADGIFAIKVSGTTFELSFTASAIKAQPRMGLGYHWS